MSLTDGTRGTLVNGHERPFKLTKIDETPEAEVFELTPQETAVPVDRPGADPTPQTGHIEKQPLLPAWAKSRTEAKAQASNAAARYGHTAAYHAIRSPLYALKLASLAPAGMARCTKGAFRWVTDAEGSPVRTAAVRREDADGYLSLSRQRNDRVKLRGLLAAVAAVFGTIVACALYVLAPGWLDAFAGISVLILGRLGQPADHPVIGPAVVIPKAERLTSEIVLRALGAMGVSGINQAIAKGKDPLAFTAPITRDGPGWLAEGDLPFGVTAGDVMEKRERLATGLRRPLGCVWPEGAAEVHPGRLRMWIGDEDMAKAKQPAWPLLKAGQVDLFKAIPYGTDQRGRWVTTTLMYLSGVIGAIPRMGKTFLLRELMLIAALDPRAELHTYDLKGTGDLDPVGDQVSYRHSAGDDDEDIEYMLDDLREVRQEMRRRTKAIRELPRDICPESKVTSDLASRKALCLHPIVIGMDECQIAFEHPQYGAEFEEICTDLVKRGPATGVTLLLATQRPDSSSLPTGIRANAVARWCLKVTGQQENDMVLGTSAYKTGIRATMFSFGDKGIHYFAGEGDAPRIVRSVYLDAPTSELIATRARKAREAAGTLAGYCVGQQPERQTASYDLLGDILAVVPAAEEKCWNERIAARLAELRPEVYGGWKAENVTTALKPHGVTAMDVWGTTDDGKGTTRRGIERARIVHAVEHRKRA